MLRRRREPGGSSCSRPTNWFLADDEKAFQSFPNRKVRSEAALSRPNSKSFSFSLGLLSQFSAAPVLFPTTCIMHTSAVLSWTQRTERGEKRRALQKYICNFPLKILDWSQTCNFGTSCTFFHHDDDDDASEIIHCRSWSLQQQLSPALSSSAFANERKVQNNSELPKHFSYAVTKDSLVNWVVGQQICNQK